jgi:hypothetical protein
VAAGIDVNAERDSGATPLLIACIYGPKDYTDLVRFLLDSKAGVNGVIHRGKIPLHEAARKGRLGVAQLLLEYGADVNAAYAGTGALEHAADEGHADVEKLLLDAGATRMGGRRYDGDEDDDGPGAEGSDDDEEEEEEEEEEAAQSVDPRQLAPGARVWGYYTSNGNWYTAKVVSCGDDGLYQVAWNDGDTADTMKQLDELKITAAQIAPAQLLLAEGDALEGLFQKDEWCPCKVAAVGEGSITVAWDDGDTRDTVKKFKEVRFRARLVADRLQ